MTQFDTVFVVDWSAGEAKSDRPQKDAIWIGITRDRQSFEPIYCPSRKVAERILAEQFRTEAAAGRRVLAAFDFPFGFPQGFASKVAGSPNPLRLWTWLEARVRDDDKGRNNRFAVAEKINRQFRTPGPYWGKPWQWADRYPDIPATKHDAGVVFAPFDEFRACELYVKETSGKTTSSCFQLSGHPTVGGQVLTGLPVLERLRKRCRARVWPFEETEDAQLVFAEIWPSLIDDAVAVSEDVIRDSAQVRLLSEALARLPAERLATLMTVPEIAREEAWILGAGAQDILLAGLVGAAVSTAPTAPGPANDCFALPPGVDWTPVDEALEQLRGALQPVVDAEAVSLDNALGRILAEPVTAQRSNPPGPNAAVDGYGFAHSGSGVSSLRLVEGRAAAGAPYPHKVPEGHAIRILTGALLPEGVDTVALEEDCTIEGRELTLPANIKSGANTRRAGEDVVAGAEILEQGRRLRPPDLALLAATGHRSAHAYRRLRIAVLSTGDELAQPGSTENPAKTYDANRPMLISLAKAWHADPVDLGSAPDDRDAIRAALDDGADSADLILTSGGASAGDEDHISALLREEGQLTAWRIALKPGRPLALAKWRGTPVMGLPGNPVAALVCALIFARPAVGVLAGEGWHVPPAVTVPAAFSKAKKPGRREFLRARLNTAGAAEVFGSEGSGRISGLSWAEGLVELPDEAAAIKPGDPVRYLPYAGFGL